MKCTTITSSPDVRSGEPVLRGTRVLAAEILADIADGSNIVGIAVRGNLDLNLVHKFLTELSDWMASEGKDFCSAECAGEDG